MKEMNQKCGCGREGRYFNIEGNLASCNKHGRCMTYEELKLELEKERGRFAIVSRELSELKKAIRTIKNIF